MGHFISSLTYFQLSREGCGKLSLSGQFFQPLVEITAGKLPLEGLCNFFIMPFKLCEAFGHDRERWKIIGCQHLLLQDGKVNLDLIEPTGMHRPMHER